VALTAPVLVRHRVFLQQATGHQIPGQLGLRSVGDATHHDDLSARPPQGIEIVFEQTSQSPQAKRFREGTEYLPGHGHPMHAGDVAKRVHEGIEVVKPWKATR